MNVRYPLSTAAEASERLSETAAKGAVVSSSVPARLVYRMLKYGQEYIDKGTQYYEERSRRQQLEHLKKAAMLDLRIVEAQP
jgi:hypothetical protein